MERILAIRDVGYIARTSCFAIGVVVVFSACGVHDSQEEHSRTTRQQNHAAECSLGDLCFGTHYLKAYRSVLDRPNSIETLTMELQQTRSRADIYAHRGVAYLVAGQFEEAERDFDSSARLDRGGDSELAIWRAHLLVCQHRDQEAIDMLLKSGDFMSDEQSLLIATAALIVARSDNPLVFNPSDAMAFAKRAAECARTGRSNLVEERAIAAALAADGRYDEAVQRIQAAIPLARKHNFKPSVLEFELNEYKNKRRIPLCRKF